MNRRDRHAPHIAVRFAVAAAVAVAVLHPSAVAAEERPKWELGAGGVFFTHPDYVGSDEYRFDPIPFPWFVWRGTRIRLDRESMQAKIFGTKFVRLDLSAGGQVSVDSNDNDRRHGMPDRDWMLQIGPTLRFPVTQSDDGEHTLEVDVPLRVALAIDTDNFSYEGLVSSPKLQYRFEPERWRFEVDAGLEFYSNEYDEYYYSVAPQFATPARSAYGADGGYAGVRLSTGVSRYFGPIYIGLFARYQNLEGATFGDSPLVGTSHAFTGGIAIGWVWFKSKEMVPVGAAANIARREAAEPEMDRREAAERDAEEVPSVESQPDTRQPAEPASE